VSAAEGIKRASSETSQSAAEVRAAHEKV